MENETGVIILLTCNRKRSFRKTGVVLKRTVFFVFSGFFFIFLFFFSKSFWVHGPLLLFFLLSSNLSALPLLYSLPPSPLLFFLLPQWLYLVPDQCRIIKLFLFLFLLFLCLSFFSGVPLYVFPGDAPPLHVFGPPPGGPHHKGPRSGTEGSPNYI